MCRHRWRAWCGGRSPMASWIAPTCLRFCTTEWSGIAELPIGHRSRCAGVSDYQDSGFRFVSRRLLLIAEEGETRTLTFLICIASETCAASSRFFEVRTRSTHASVYNECAQNEYVRSCLMWR